MASPLAPRDLLAGFTLIELLTAIAIIVLLAAVLVPRFWRARERTAFTACGQNLASIATALQTYANESEQLYPTALSNLLPKYLSTIPTCPAANANTYNASYSKSDDPRNFTIFCQGSFHTPAGVNADEPWYTLTEGLNPK